MEEMDFKAMLTRFHDGGFQKGEAVILSNFGTNQTLLSIIFDFPNNIKVIFQEDKDGLILRRVELYCGETLVCTATTIVPKSRNRPEVLADILAGKLGLGQIVVKHNLPNKRVLLDIYRWPEAFSRIYAIDGPEVYLEITEEFPREPFIIVGWIQPEEAK